MLNRVKVFLVVLFLLNLNNLIIAKDNYKNLKYIPGKVLVKYKSSQNINGTNQFFKIQSKYGITKIERTIETSNLKKKVGIEELESLFTFYVPTSVDIKILSAQISSEPNVEFAQPDYLHPFDKIPNDPQWGNLYPLPQVKADTAWGISIADSNVVIGIIDSGVDWDHEDLASVIWKNKNEIAGNGIDDDNNGFKDDIRGWDFVSGIPDPDNGEDGADEDNDPMDFDGHGTHVSGIAGGATNNSIGIASIGWGVRIMPLRSGYHSSDGNGYIPSSFASKAYVYAANNGATAANQSSGTSEVVLVGALYAFKNGVVICNSAGNGNSESIGLLGEQSWALSVGALASNDKKASYSSFSQKVDISAPGGDFSGGNFKGFLSSVVSPSSFYGNKLYEYFQGTSMSSPMVAGLAGLIKSKFPNMSAGDIMFQILGTADNINSVNPNYVGKLGAGRINALRAITETPTPPKPDLSLTDFKIDDLGTGNGNGQIEPGEEIKLVLTLQNNWGPAKNVSVNLKTTHWTTIVSLGTVNFNSINGINKIDSSSKSNSADPFKFKIDADAIPTNIPFTITITADGGFSKTIQLSLGINSQILYVDDDDGFNSEQYYFDALNKSGVVYDYWDHSTKGTPSAETLKKYNIVIWACEWAFPSLDSDDRNSLEQYLNNKGKLFISGQDIGWDMCDVDGATVPNEYGRSGGASKTWYEKYLKAIYLNDDAKFDQLIGNTDDPISNGLSIKRFQPGRATTEQYPEVLGLNGGSKPSFQYSGGTFVDKLGAVTYSGNDYKLVHFGFGGIESVTETLLRTKLMTNIIGWLIGSSVSVDKLFDTENNTNPYVVNAKVNSADSIETINLFWDTDGTFPFKKVQMANNGNGNYTGNIPVQTQSGELQYFVLVKTSKSFLPFFINSFRVGPDVVPPVLIVKDTLQNTARLVEPYKIFAISSDNLSSGIDTNNFYLNYSVNNGIENKILFSKSDSVNKYFATLTPPLNLKADDEIEYYITVKDNSTQKNQSRFPISGKKIFTISKELVDNFELKNNKWNYGLWDLTTTVKFSGTQSVTDSKTGNYTANTVNILEYKEGINLTKHNKISFYFYRRANIHSSDTCFVEASKDGVNWKTFSKGKFTGLNIGFKREEFGLDDFTGAGSENVKIRFRLVSDSLNQSDGIYLEDFGFVVGKSITTGLNDKNNLPTSFNLEQNYPNPFNPSTNIKFSIPVKQNVKVEIFDILGKNIATLINDELEAGNYKINFDGNKISSGIYFYSIKTNSFSDVKKMMYLK